MNVSKFREQILKKVSPGIFLWNYFKIGPAVSEKKIFLRISLCPYSARSPLSPEPFFFFFLFFLTDQNFANSFWKGSPEEHSCEIISKSDQRLRCLKKLLTTDDGHSTSLKAPLEHVVLRWAKKKQVWFFWQPWSACFPTQQPLLWNSNLNMFTQ